MGQESRHPIRTLLLLGLLLVVGIGAAFYAAANVEPDSEDPAAPGAAPAGDAAPGATTSAQRKSAAPAVPGTDAKIRGVVRLYRTKAVVAGLALTLKPAEGNALAATTGEDGVFRFEHVTPGPGWQLGGVREPFAAIAMPLEVLPSEDKDLGTLWLEVPVSLTAIVIDLEGKPLKDATVDVFSTSRAAAEPANDENWWWDQRAWEQRILALTSSPKPTKSGTCDAAGKATIDGLMPGTYRVRASAAGYATATRGGVLLAPDAASAPVRLILGPGHRLEGTVTDEKNAPLAGVNVIGAAGDDWGVGLDKWSATTNEKGAYALTGLAAGALTIYLDRPGKPLLKIGATGIPETSRYDIRLRPGGTMRGTVTDEDGKPVAKAEVRTAMQDSWSPMATTTDKDGKYELADVPAGPIAYFRIECAGYMPFPDPSAPRAGAGESLREGAVMVRDAILRRGLAAELHVVGADTNAPIEGCEATLYVSQQWGGGGQPWKATTDKDGVAKVAGLVPGNYLVVLKAPGFVQEGLPPWFLNLLQSPDAMPAQWRLNLGGEGGVAKGEYRLTRGAVVTGRVWDQNKQPVAGARVTVQGSRSEFPVFSDGEGKFRMDAVAPANRCQAEASGPNNTHGVSEPFVVRPGQTVENIDVKLAQCGRVTGSVRTPDGKPPVGAMVRFVMGKLDAENNAWAFQQFQSSDKYPVTTDGRFEIPAVPEGNVTVRADAEGYLPAWKNDVVVTGGQETGGLDLILKSSLAIAGRVEAQSGGAVAGAQIFAQYGGKGDQQSWNGYVTGLSGEPSAQSDADGRFTLKGLEDGNYEIRASAPGFASSTNVATKTGAGDVIIRLAPGLKISGVVKDEAQKPVGGVPVRASKMENQRQNEWWWWGNNAQVYTAPDGTFELSDLADGAYDLTVSAMWQWGREVNVEDTKLSGVNAGRDDVAITVRTGSTIEGRIVDRDEKPVRVAWITAQFEAADNRNEDWSSQRWAQAKPDGTFRVVGLKPGSYTLWAYGDFKYTSIKGVGSGSKDAKIVVEPGFSIWGKIVDAAGLSLASEVNFMVRKSGEQDWTWTNVVQPGDGNFVVLGLDQGRYDLQIQGDGFAPVVVPNATSGDRDLVVTLQKGLEMSGSVVDGSGNAVPGANVWAQQLNPAQGVQPAQSSADADDKGNFKLAGLAAGDYRVIVRAQKFAPAILPPIAAGTSGVKAVLEGGVSLSGTVVDEAGAAFAGHAGNSNLWLATEAGVQICWCELKADGTFQFDNVPSNQKWNVQGWAWTPNAQYQFGHEGLVESGATDVKVVAKTNR
jgi:protocatechuate 3,4-dioxygenase beta subunit